MLEQARKVIPVHSKVWEPDLASEEKTKVEKRYSNKLLVFNGIWF